jgi:sulfane dehydrogenase subunit SoxC
MSDPIIPVQELEPVAGNGLLHRRLFLAQGAGLLGAGLMTASVARAVGPAEFPDSMRLPGPGASAYGERSKFENGIGRLVRPGTGAVPAATAAMTPLDRLEGTITPGSLHFERHHTGIPEIDPGQHRLLIHGLVRRPLEFSLDALARYPLVSRVHFVECSGNSGSLNGPTPVQATAGQLHGLLSCSEWTGVPLAILLDEAGIDPRAQWLLAEGGDAAAMGRSVPLPKAMDDAMVAIYQNGEAIRPANGYPMRLLLPGYEGNTNIKWLRRIKLATGPTMTRDETSKYTDLMADGKSRMFSLVMDPKSVITNPSYGQKMRGPGLYQVSGLAWSGHGRIRRVEVSADGGKTWAEAALSDLVATKATTRFRMPWRWDGSPSVLMSRAIDEAGNVQVSRSQLLASMGSNFQYHNSAITCWSVAANGEIAHVYA